MFPPFRERIAAHLPKSRVARSIITLASGTAVAQIITICSMPIVTRLYTPAQFGVISLFLAFFGFWAATLSLRYEYALLIAKDDAESHVVHRLAIMLVAVMSLLGLPLLLGLHVTGVLGFGLLPNWAPFVAVPILFGYGIFMVYRSWALRAGIIKQITKASIARSAANSSTRIIFGFFGGGIPGLFAAEFAGAWGAMLKLTRSSRAYFLSSRPRTISTQDLVVVARKFMRFAVFETPSVWIDQLAVILPVTIVASLHGAAAAGWYGLARSVAGIPNAQLGSAVADVFHREAAAAVVVNDFVRVRHLFYKMADRLAFIGLLPFVGVLVLSPWLTPVIFGEQWYMTGWTIAALAPWLYFAFIASPLSRILAVLQAQQYKFVYDVTTVMLLLLVVYVAQAWHLSYIHLVFALSAAGIVSYLVYFSLLVVVVELLTRSKRK